MRSALAPFSSNLDRGRFFPGARLPMKLSDEEIETIVNAATEGEKRSVRVRQASALRRMMKGLAEIDYRRGSAA